LKVATRHALGQYSVTPSLDFEQEPLFNQSVPTPSESNVTFERIESSFSRSSGERSVQQEHYDRNAQDDMARHRNNFQNWQTLYEDEEEGQIEEGEPSTLTIESKISNTAPELDDHNKSFSKEDKKPHQIHRRYIINQIKSGFWLIDQQAAHERILYERYLVILEGSNSSIQKKLFPQTIQLSPADTALLEEILPQVSQLGFDIENFGGNSFIVHGVPAEFQQSNEQEIIEQLLDQVKQNYELKLDMRENIARSMAVSAATKRGQVLEVEEMELLIDQLFACAMPMKSPTGRKCFISFDLEELDKRFKE
ncbi:MAG: DNA mismatch repair protein MutL, partial [Bacteroidota bacterium]